MSYVGLGWSSGGRNPLDGSILLPYQQVVSGPANTGPRQTVVDTRNPATWPRWVTAGPDGSPVDLGNVPGGTWDGSGAQTLPEVGVTGFPPLAWLLGALVLVLVLSGTGRQSRGDW